MTVRILPAVVAARAAPPHASQISPGAVLWRQLGLLGEWEYLRRLVPPGQARERKSRSS